MLPLSASGAQAGTWQLGRRAGCALVCEVRAGLMQALRGRHDCWRRWVPCWRRRHGDGVTQEPTERKEMRVVMCHLP